MTIEELHKSDAVKQWLAELLKQGTFQAILDAMQRLALPSGRSVQPKMVPGVHPDTALAHDTNYWAGWSDCIQYLKAIPTGSVIDFNQGDEELFAHTPEVAEIDKQIEAAKHQPATP